MASRNNITGGEIMGPNSSLNPNSHVAPAAPPRGGLEGGGGMNWRLMWRDYCDVVTEMIPIVLGIVSLAIVWVAVIASALAILRGCW